MNTNANWLANGSKDAEHASLGTWLCALSPMDHWSRPSSPGLGPLE